MIPLVLITLLSSTALTIIPFTATTLEILDTPSFDGMAVAGLLDWFENPSAEVEKLAELPAHQIMEQLNALNAERPSPPLLDVLHGFDIGDPQSGLDYGLRGAADSLLELRSLFEAIAANDSVWRKCMVRANQFFPSEHTPSKNFPVFLTLLGWEWGDAMMFSFKINGEKVSVDSTGTPAIIFNLTLVNRTYGDSLEERLSSFENVLSHELFHALLAGYAADHWEKFDATLPLAHLRFVMLNEGVAHFVSEKQQLSLPENEDRLRVKEVRAFDALARRYAAMQDLELKEAERLQLVEKGTYGPFWEKDVCIVGMFMAYHIHHYRGEAALTACIERGPNAFVSIYHELCEAQPFLPRLPDGLRTIMN